MKLQTKCIHSGGHRDPLTRGINTPIYTSSAYEYLDRDDQPYPRYCNTPNHSATVGKICALEDAEGGLLFASGMAAIATTLFTFLHQGQRGVFQDEIYGGTYQLLQQELPRQGIKAVLAKSDADSIIAAMEGDIRLVYLESPTNPLLTIVDIKRITRAAREKNILTIIDNTFASPINQNPIALGIDLVVHSGTKYLGGHSDLCCGVVVGRKALIEKIAQSVVCYGGSLGAEGCALLERSLKTLALRVREQTTNAMEIAEFLENDKRVSRVYYPGLKAHPGHETALQQMHGFGAMLSFELRDCDPIRFQKKLQLIIPAMSLGGVESTITQPATTSHEYLSKEEREKMGVVDGLLRLSVGIESVDDLMADLKRGLS